VPLDTTPGMLSKGGWSVIRTRPPARSTSWIEPAGSLRRLRPHVPMVEATYAGQAGDPRSGRRTRLDWSTIGRVPEAGVGPLGVVVGNIVSEQAPEMRFAEDDHVIEKLSSTGSHPPLASAVFSRRGRMARFARADAAEPERRVVHRGSERAPGTAQRSHSAALEGLALRPWAMAALAPGWRPERIGHYIARSSSRTPFLGPRSISRNRLEKGREILPRVRDPAAPFVVAYARGRAIIPDPGRRARMKPG